MAYPGSRRVNVKLAGRRGLDHVAAQHQVLHVGLRDDHAMSPVEATGAADVEKSLHLLVDPPIACTSPRWSTEPVTAIHWRIGTSARTDRSAHASATEALSPSINP